MGCFEIVNGRLSEYKGDEERVEIPKEVSRIGHQAFKDKKNLKEVIIPSSVNKIDTESFENCPKLRKLFIPASVLRIEDCFVEECQALESICVAEENEEYKSVDGVLYTKDGEVLVLYPPQKKNKIFEIPESVTLIDYGVFHETNLTLLVKEGSYGHKYALKNNIKFELI